jgi:hypothetical protein
MQNHALIQAQWKAREEELLRQLHLTKTKLSHIEKAERGKFEEMHKVIAALRQEIEYLRSQPGVPAGESGAGGRTAAAPPDLEPSAAPREEKLSDENERLSRRLRDQRELIESLMKTKTKLLEQVNAEVKRNAFLVKENAALLQTLQSSQASHTGDGGGALRTAPSSSSASPSLNALQLKAKELQTDLPQNNADPDANVAATHLSTSSPVNKVAQSPVQKPTSNTNHSSSHRHNPNSTGEADDESPDQDPPLCSSNGSIIVTVSTETNNVTEERIVLRRSGWLSLIPLVGRYYEKTFHKIPVLQL